MRPRRVITRALTLVCLATVLAVAIGCGGGGDDIKDIQATATAAAKTRPSPTATPDLVTAYRTKVTAGAQKLGDATDTLIKDMLAAAESQADPKWPPVLQADAAAIAAAATSLKSLAPPGDTYKPFAAQLDTAIDSLSRAAVLLKQTVQTADPALGAHPFELLGKGKGQLAAALAALPPG